MTLTRRIIVSAWLGFALAALFFYPLAAALDTDIYYLQWQPSDLVETTVVLAVCALAAAGALFVLWPRSSRWATIALMAVAALPLASFVAGLARQIPYNDELRLIWESRAVRFAVPAAASVLVALAFILWPRGLNRWFRRLLIGLSPVSLVVVGSLVTSARHAPFTVMVDREASGSPATPNGCAPVLALLFDELSFSYLYDDNGDVRPQFPEIRRLASTATNYLAVAAPGRETLTALPSFLASRHVTEIRVAHTGIFEPEDGLLQPFSATEPEGLFGTARTLGFRTEMAGHYHAYCDLLGELVDACRSLSFYNVSTTDEGFSPMDPVLTTLVLWPRQFPFGLLKNPPFAVLQRRLVEETVAFARRPMLADRPVFRFVHFSVPHFPYVFDADGYDPPFDPLRTSPDTAYVEQLQFVDSLVGDLTRQLREQGAYEGATIALLADHGFRFGGRERDPLKIPFIVKMARQTARIDVTRPIAGEQLLKQVLQRSCPAPSGS